MTPDTPRSEGANQPNAVPATVDDCWRLEGHRARWRAAAIDLDHPLDGIAARLGIGVGPAGGEDHLLGVDLRAECRIADHWQRGRDLTAVYEPADDRQLRASAMWRISDLFSASSPSIAAWECVVSAQTSLLHSDVSLAVVSQFAAAHILWGRLDADLRQPAFTTDRPETANAILARRDADTSLLLVAHPLDPHQISCDRTQGRATVRHWLFSAAVEKGVLLRSRVLAAIGPSENDTAWAALLSAAFASSPPILTA